MDFKNEIAIASISALQRTNSKKYAPEDKLIFQPQFNELFDIWEEYMETQKSIAQ